MLQKLRSRYPIDLPADGFGTKKAILAVLGGIAVLFLIVPFLLSPLAALLRGARSDDGVLPVVIAIGAAFGLLALVLVVGGIRGKPGHARK